MKLKILCNKSIIIDILKIDTEGYEMKVIKGQEKIKNIEYIYLNTTLMIC